MIFLVYDYRETYFVVVFRRVSIYLCATRIMLEQYFWKVILDNCIVCDVFTEISKL